MNKLQKAAIGFTIITASLVSAFAAPIATRHNKLLSIKQRVMMDTGESITSASLVSPTAHGSNSGLVTLTNRFAAVPLSDSEVANFQAARVPRFNYEAFWASMDALQACENQLSDNAAAYDVGQYGNSDSGEYASYVYQTSPIAPGKYADGIMNGATPISSLPSQYAGNGSAGLCSSGGDPAAYSAAVAVRQAVSNYARDSLEALDYITSQHVKSGAADALKKAVVQYLRDNEIEHAWVDVEFEYNHLDAPFKRRIAMSFQINRADEPTTVGTYMGSQLVLTPTATVEDAQISARNNIIDIKYTAYSQYPDFTVNSTANNTYLNGLLRDNNYNSNGFLTWNVNTTGNSAISSTRMCANGTCTNPDGSTGKFKTTSGVYDPVFIRAGSSTDTTAPYTLENVNPIDDLSGVNCLVTGKGNTNCRIEKHNVSTLMQYSNSISGTLDYLGRWEVDFAQHKPKFEEISRAGVFDVCYGVEFKNQVAASYWVRRPHLKLKLYWQPGGVQYEKVFAEYDYFDAAVLPEPVRYTTYATPKNGYNLVDRSNASTAKVEDRPTNYVAVNLTAYDPQTFNLPDREGVLMINPFVSLVSSDGRLYNGLANNWLSYRLLPEMVDSSGADTSMASSMFTSNSQPIYKQADISTPSNALPTGWLARGNSALERIASFNCVDQNEPRVRDLQGQYQASLGSVGRRNEQPAEQAKPSGIYPGTVQGHKSGTRPTVDSSFQLGADPDACQLSYVPWSNVDVAQPVRGPYPDPEFVAPPICSTMVTVGKVTTPYPGPECIPPVNYYIRDFNVTNVGALTYVDSIQPACDEQCPVGGNIKLCQRPYSRF